MKVQIKNYQIVKDLDFEIKGVTVISGKSNNGKSAIYRAIRAACFGHPGDYFIRHGQKSVSVTLQEDHNWTWARAGLTSFTLDDKTFEKTGGKAPDEYADLLGIKQIPMAKSSVVPNFAAQFEGLFVVGLSPTEASSALSFLFSGEKFPNLLKHLSKVVRDYKKEATYVEGQINSTEKALAGLADQQQELEKYRKWFELRPQMATWRDEVQDLGNDVDEMEGLIDELNQLKNQYTIDKNNQTKLQHVDDNKLNELRELSETVDRVIGLEGEVRSVSEEQKELEKTLFYLNGMSDEVLDLMLTAHGEIHSIELLIMEIGEIQTREQLIKEEVQTLDQNIAMTAENLQDCPYCGCSLDSPARTLLLENVGGK